MSCYIDDRDYHQEMAKAYAIAKVYVLVYLGTFYIDQQVDKRGASSF